MQMNRLFEILYLLLNKDSMTAGELAKQFEVSTRTIYRDVELLSSAGVPIYMTQGRGGGIALLPGFVLNKAILTDEEKADILAALQAVEAVSLEEGHTALRKLSSLLGSHVADWIEVDFSDWDNAEQDAQRFAQLKMAILERRRIRFRYHSSQRSTSRTVEPLKLCFKGQAWYLYAYCTLREDERFFKLRRIQDMELLDETFQRVAPAKLFKSGEVFPDVFVTMRLRLAPEMAYRVYDEFPHYDQQPDGSFVVELTMPRGEWVYQYLATFGEYGEVIEPENIRVEIQEKLKKTLARYL